MIKQFEKTKLAMKKLSKNRSMQAQFMNQLGGNAADMEALAKRFGR